ncbi:MAG TPA: helix-turn-helix domain-containing protein [Acidimicrobiales bacterium]|nr:helix-turn-helix domain-containing protein [Acidimicrobiales bacterium]
MATPPNLSPPGEAPPPPAGAAPGPAAVAGVPRPRPVDEHRRTARERIVRAARSVLAERGFATRVEDVAAVAGVSRRTVFRYFESREALLAAAIADSLRSYGAHVPRHRAGEELEAWLERALVAVHRMNAHHGRVYFELASGLDLDGELAAIAAARREARAGLVQRFATIAWRVGGGSGTRPDWLHDAVAVLLSTFATEALARDFERSPDEIGRATARMLAHAVRGAVGAQGGGPPA